MLIVRKHRKTFHPIRHILMIQFLTNSIEDFFSNNNFKEDHTREGLWSSLKIKEENYVRL